MKQGLSRKFFVLFIIVHVFFIVTQIYNYTRFISQSYLKQKNEKIVSDLIEQRQDLVQRLYVLKDLKTVQQNAKDTCGMKEIKLHQIKKIHSHAATT